MGYYRNAAGEYHRTNGPAWITYYGNGQVKYKEFYIKGVKLSRKKFLYKVYIDGLYDPVSREQAVQLAEQAGWTITVKQLNKAAGLTLKEKREVNLSSPYKTVTYTYR